MNYKEILQDILTNGQPKQPVRFKNGFPIPVENGTIGLFGSVFNHNMNEGFPLTTLRKMPFRSTAVELEGFIKGITSKGWYQSRKCSYWDHWANPQVVRKILKVEMAKPSWSPGQVSKEELERAIQKSEDDLGPCLYGASWRNFHDPEAKDGDHIDQLEELVNKLKVNPYDRRMIVSSWNPLGFNHTALPACHTQFTVCVYGDTLNLGWDQRSCDWLINQTICTYGLLLLLLCEESGLKPGNLQGRFIDNHIYENQMEAAQIIVGREEHQLPTVKIKRKSDGSFSIFDWTYDEVELIGYDPHPPVNMGSITV